VKREVKVTHPERVMFPADGITKGDLVAYYERVSEWMLPHVKGRPVSMQRFNAGIAKGGFFQKNLPKGAPGWLKTATVPKRDGTVTHPLVTDAAAQTLRCLHLGAPLAREPGDGPRLHPRLGHQPCWHREK